MSKVDLFSVRIMNVTSRSKQSPKLLLTVLALGVAACQTSSDPFGVYGGGAVQFVLSSSDAAATGPALSPAEHGEGGYGLASANVTFSSILARNLDGQLIDVAIDELPVTLDIVRMEDGRTVTLPDGELPAATYDQIVVVMTEVQVVTHHGTTVTIEPPGGGWTAIIPICPFIVEDGATTVVGLTLPIRRAFRWIDGGFRFRPEFRCGGDDDEETDDDSSDGDDSSDDDPVSDG